MPGFNISNPIASEVQAVSFDSLSTKDILAISVKQIVNPNTFDGNGNPRDGGLYDSALGPFIKSISCSTCNLSGDNCPGHVGHILLPTPVYHPVFFDQTMRLLRSTCVYCHRLRMSRREVNRYVCKFKLVQNGLLDEAAKIDEFQVESVKDDEEEVMSDAEDDVESLIKRREKFVKASLKKAKESGKSNHEKVNSILAVRRGLVKDFMAAITTGKKCQNCKGISPVFRKDGYSKLFERPLLPKDQLAMTQLGFVRNNLTIDIKSRTTTTNSRDKIAESAVAEVIEDQVEAVQTMTADSKTGRILTALEVHSHLSQMFEKESVIMGLVYQTTVDKRFRSRMARKVTADMFFLQAIAVPPTPFRAPTVTGKEMNENSQNTALKKIMESCLKIRDLNDEMRTNEAVSPSIIYGRLVREFINLQDEINTFIDSTRAVGPNRAVMAAAATGIKQILEKKEGLFRMNMMGKRVNFAARSVISPDPNIETSEIGVPLVFARKLTYPEPVTPHNVEIMRQAVINGPDFWPGATHIEYENGRLQKLPASLESRKALANQLLTPSDTTSKSINKKVYRHVQNGDMVLMNRQPTLHKPSIMGHKVRVLKKENTIRMHYANCNTYNADFDGDEMNMHLPQNENARAEAQLIANTDSQYLVATSGKPLRGLIQDHIVMGVYMTKRDTFYSKGEFQQLLYASLRPEDGHTVGDRIELLPPAIMKPRKLWTGKQVISCILANIRPSGYEGLSLISKSQTPANRWADDSEEGQVIFHKGTLVCGILDKSQFGSAAFGLVHSVYEVYGNETAGKLLSILGRLFTKFLHMRAFTCGMDDLLLTPAGNEMRRSLIDGAEGAGREVAAKYVGLEGSALGEESQLRSRLEEVLRDDTKQGNLDGVMNARTKTLTSEVISEALPRGLDKPFPCNQMQAMTISGAKGSDVNASQISCLLGQQVLEGRRVPVMVSGKTLPSFKPYDTRTRAGGYITDRFLTGIRPQEYYFHAMAGREGLIDTAVKTSRSGYLQRCLIKGMEGMTVQYDNSVRDSDGSLVQFLYGEDSLDVTKQKHLKDFKFHALNAASFIRKLKIQEVAHMLDVTSATEYQKGVMKKLKKRGPYNVSDPSLAVYSPSKFVGSVSENFEGDLEKYVKGNPDNLITKNGLQKAAFRALMHYKYMNSVVEPGEAVGLLAGQSVGEPSTQMTLNTFHLAGHSAKNVTLGIPRLREIVMTASASISTPTMTLLLHNHVSNEIAESFAKRVSRTTLAEVVDKVYVTESIAPGFAQSQAKIYKIRLEFYPREDYESEYQVSQEDLLATMEGEFLARLIKDITKSQEKAAATVSDSKPSIGQSKAVKAAKVISQANVDVEDDEDVEGDSDNDENEGDAKSKSRQMQSVSYEDPDESEEEISKEVGESEEDEEEEPEHELVSNGDVMDVDAAEVLPLKKTKKSKKPRKKVSPKTREMVVKATHSDVMTFAFDNEHGRWCEIELEYAVDSAKLLMIGIVEKACKTTVVHQLAGIKKCIRIEDDISDRENPKRQLSTDGVNFHAMWDYEDIIKTSGIYTNDIVAMLNVFGVEAARSTIVREMSSVFTGHGIQVDTRHLNLIADIMTRAGGFSPFNRIGLKSDVSPFLKMSFETTTAFLKEAALEGDHDDLKSPSARIVLGRLSKVGTGSFEIMTST